MDYDGPFYLIPELGWGTRNLKVTIPIIILLVVLTIILLVIYIRKIRKNKIKNIIVIILTIISVAIAIFMLNYHDSDKLVYTYPQQLINGGWGQSISPIIINDGYEFFTEGIILYSLVNGYLLINIIKNFIKRK